MLLAANAALSSKVGQVGSLSALPWRVNRQAGPSVFHRNIVKSYNDGAGNVPILLVDPLAIGRQVRQAYATLICSNLVPINGLFKNFSAIIPLERKYYTPM